MKPDNFLKTVGVRVRIKRLGMLVKDRRTEMGITQSELARRFGAAQQTVSLFENEGKVSLRQLVLMLDELGLDIQIVRRDESETCLRTRRQQLGASASGDEIAGGYAAGNRIGG